MVLICLGTANKQHCRNFFPVLGIKLRASHIHVRQGLYHWKTAPVPTSALNTTACVFHSCLFPHRLLLHNFLEPEQGEERCACCKADCTDWFHICPMGDSKTVHLQFLALEEWKREFSASRWMARGSKEKKNCSGLFQVWTERASKNRQEKREPKEANAPKWGPCHGWAKLSKPCCSVMPTNFSWVRDPGESDESYGTSNYSSMQFQDALRDLVVHQWILGQKFPTFKPRI